VEDERTLVVRLGEGRGRHACGARSEARPTGPTYFRSAELHDEVPGRANFEKLLAIEPICSLV